MQKQGRTTFVRTKMGDAQHVSPIQGTNLVNVLRSRPGVQPVRPRTRQAHLIVELRNSVDWEVLGPGHQSVCLIVPRGIVILVDELHAAAHVCGALFEVASVLLFGFADDEDDEDDGEPNWEGVVLDPSEVAQLCDMVDVAGSVKKRKEETKKSDHIL